MPYTSDPANSATDRIRLQVGDTDAFDEELSDGEYDYFLDITTSEAAATIKALEALVAKYAQYTRERTGQVEYYAQDKYKNYKDLLTDALDPRKGKLSVGAGVSGGVSKSRMKTVRSNTDNNHTDTYQGWTVDKDYTAFEEG